MVFGELPNLKKIQWISVYYFLMENDRRLHVGIKKRIFVN